MQNYMRKICLAVLAALMIALAGQAAEEFGLKLGGGSGLNHRGPFSGQVTGGGQAAEPSAAYFKFFTIFL